MIDKKSEAYRRECEARTVLSWEFERRRPYLDLVGKRRGAEALKELEVEIRRQHRLAKAAA